MQNPYVDLFKIKKSKKRIYQEDRTIQILCGPISAASEYVK